MEYPKKFKEYIQSGGKKKTTLPSSLIYKGHRNYSFKKEKNIDKLIFSKKKKNIIIPSK